MPGKLEQNVHGGAGHGRGVGTRPPLARRGRRSGVDYPRGQQGGGPRRRARLRRQHARDTGRRCSCAGHIPRRVRAEAPRGREALEAPAVSPKKRRRGPPAGARLVYASRAPARGPRLRFLGDADGASSASFPCGASARTRRGMPAPRTRGAVPCRARASTAPPRRLAALVLHPVVLSVLWSSYQGQGHIKMLSISATFRRVTCLSAVAK